MVKIWSALKKHLRSQVTKDRCVEFPLAGKFLRRGEVVVYMPALDLLSSGHLKFPENENNVSPLGKTLAGFQKP